MVCSATMTKKCSTQSEGRSDFQFWLNCGGDAALDSYGSSRRLELIPRNHIRFLESCRSYYETDTHIFLHANYKPDVPLDQQDDYNSLAVTERLRSTVSALFWQNGCGWSHTADIGSRSQLVVCIACDQTSARCVQVAWLYKK